MEKRRIITGVVLTAGTLASIFAVRGYRAAHDFLPAGKDAPALIGARQVAGACAQSLPIHYGFKEGTAYRYSFRRSIEAAMGGKPLTEVKLDGEFRVEVASATADKLDLLVSAEAHMRSDAEKLDEKLPILPPGGKSGPEHQLRVRMDTRGGTVEIQAVAGAEAGSEAGKAYFNVLKDALASFILPLPELRKAGESMEVTGTDSTGSYDAQVSFSDCDVLMKKTAYRAYGSKTPIHVAASEHRLVLMGAQGPHGNVPSAIVGEDRLEIEAMNNLKSTSRHEFRLQDATPSTVPAAVLARFKVPSKLEPSHDAASDTQMIVSADPNRKDPVTWKGLQQELAGLTKPGRPEGSLRTRVFQDLTSLLLSQPGLLGELREYATTVPTRSDAYRIVVGAINTLGTPEAQKALISLYHSPDTDTAGKQTVLSAFTLNDSGLTSDTKSFLGGVVQDQKSTEETLRDSARYALGSAMRNAPDPQSAALLAKTYENAGTPADRLKALQALGNAGLSDYLPAIEKAADPSNKDTDLRREAIYALRFVQTPQADTDLQQALAPETPVDVQEAAVRAIRLRRSLASFEPGLVNCVKGSASDSLAGLCAQAILERPTLAPQATEALRDIVNGKDAKVKPERRGMVSKQPYFNPAPGTK